MEALENLKIFCKEVEHGQFQLTAEAIDTLGNALVEAARVSEGYAKLAWQAGVYLLVESGNDGDIYTRFGYTAVANALQASLADGTFPLGLGFITEGFLPDGGLETLVRHPRIQQALATWSETKVTISPQSFRATPRAIERCKALLDHAHTLHIPLAIHLQIVACLLLTATGKAEKEQAARILLNLLTKNEKTITLFCCWRAACDLYPALWSEHTYMDSLFTLLKICRDLPDQGASILAQLHTDQDLLFALRNNLRLSYLIGLSGWWLSVRHSRKEGENTAWNFIWGITETYPELGKVLKSYLQDGHPPELPQEEIERMQKEFQKEMRTLREALRLRSYRGVPLTLDIQRYNLVTIFEPLYETLESSSELHSKVYSTIIDLDANALLDDNPIQKGAAKHLKIIGDLRSNMIKDYEAIVASARRALDLRQKLIEATPEGAPMPSLTTNDILQEVASLQREDPELRWIFAWFLPEIVQVLSPEEPSEVSENKEGVAG